MSVPLANGTRVVMSAIKPSEEASDAAPVTGTRLVRASWHLLKQDRELVLLPFLGAITTACVAIVLFIPGYGVGRLLGGGPDSQTAYWVGLALATYGATVVAIFFQAALVVGANERADGIDPTRASALRGAWERRRRILAWAVLSTTVGLALRAAQEKLGSLGALASILGGVAWSIATFLVVPVLVAENVSPLEAVRRSSSVLRSRWGTNLRTAGWLGLLGILLWVPPVLLVVLGFVLVTGDALLGFALVALGVLAMIALGTVFAAVSAYARALLYRYAVGLPTPGIDSAVLAGAFRVKAGRR